MYHKLLLLFTLCIASSDTVLGQGCRQCVVEGRKIEGNSYFTHQKECIEYKYCICNCDGGWNCPADHAIDHCRQNVSTGCYFCDVRNQHINGNSNFKFRDGCYEFNCFCKCDGGWNCPSENTVDVCNTNSNTGCKYCDVDGKKIPGNSRFDLTRNCYQYSGCICQCDGGYTCSHTKGKYACGTRRGKARYSSTEVTSVQKITSSQESYPKSSEES